MSRLRDIFKNRPEKMTNIVKWTFGLPLAYILYLVLSLFLPNSKVSNNAIIISQGLRSLLLIACLLITCKYFLKIDLSKILCQRQKWNHKASLMGFILMIIALVITNTCLSLIYPESFIKQGFTQGFSQGLSKGLFVNWASTLFLVLCAAFSEELIFRAYIAWFGKTNSEVLVEQPKKILVYALVSAALFTISHFQNPEVESAAIWSMVFYFVFGFALMLFFFRTKGIEFGFGVHVANNLFSAWIINYSNSVLPTQSLFVSTLPISFITILQAVLCLIFCSILCRN